MKPNPVPQKRVTVYIPEKEHKLLRSKLALIGQTVSGWVRENIKKFLREK
jgi:hypothetical protein